MGNGVGERIDNPPEGYSDDVPRTTVICNRCGRKIFIADVEQHNQMHMWMASDG